MSDGKESDKNPTIENVVTILAVSTMIFFLIVLPAYGHQGDGLLDANGGHRSREEGYHTHRTPKEMIELEKEALEQERKEQQEQIQNQEIDELKDDIKELRDEIDTLNQEELTSLVLNEGLEENDSEKPGNAVVHALFEEPNIRFEDGPAVWMALAETESTDRNTKTGNGDNGNTFKPASPSAKTRQESEQLSKFLDTGFGLGVGLLHGLGTKNVSATLDENGIVTVVKDETRAIDLILEAHYYPQKWRRSGGDFAHGPFVLLNTGAIDTDTETLRTFGVGWMMGVRVAGSRSINIGLAYALKHGVQSLRSNFVAGQEAPRDDMGNFIEPQYTESTERTWVILVSFSPF